MARTQVGDIITYRWDENSTLNSKIGVLDTNSSDLGSSAYRRNPDQNSTRRIGHVKGNKRRKFFSAKTYASSTLGQEGTNYDDIDDFITTQDINLSYGVHDANATIGYKLHDSNMSISVKYISDINTSSVFDFNQLSNPIGTTNIKMITVTLKNSQLRDGNLTLRAFSCNIGANQLLRKDFY